MNQRHWDAVAKIINHELTVSDSDRTDEAIRNITNGLIMILTDENSEKSLPPRNTFNVWDFEEKCFELKRTQVQNGYVKE